VFCQRKLFADKVALLGFEHGIGYSDYVRDVLVIAFLARFAVYRR
jgi:hypothetical protein